MKTNYDVILSPVITEKSTKLSDHNQIVFRVPLTATKPEIKKAIETLFKVKVTGVNTITTKGKNKVRAGRRYTKSDVKKAVVTLAAGHHIDVTTGV
jgi:large subunit ribosomal protein L23